MTSKKVTRYYCDFCRKGMFFKGRMEKHERGCTKNLNRACGICVAGKVQQKPLVELLKCLDGITDENKVEKMNLLREAANDCPACLLATLRNHPRTSFEKCDSEDQSEIIGTVFNFKTEMAAWWSEINDTVALQSSYDQ